MSRRFKAGAGASQKDAATARALALARFGGFLHLPLFGDHRHIEQTECQNHHQQNECHGSNLFAPVHPCKITAVPAK